MTELPLGSDRALQRFRAALAAAEAAPTEASVAALREAALLLKNELRAAYMAAGSPYGNDRAGMYRWIREVMARWDLDLMRCRAMVPWRTRAYSSKGAVLAGCHVVTHKRLSSK